MDFAALNEIAGNAYPAKKNWTDLEKNKKYKISSLKKVNTKFGRKIVFVVNGEFQLFVPARVSEPLYEYEDTYNNLVNKCSNNKLFILYLGNSQFKFCDE